MTTMEAQHPRLWRRDGFRATDPWVYAEDAGVADGSIADGVILPLPVFLNLDDTRRDALLGRLGVAVQPGEPLDDLVPHLAQIKLVALAFPAFNDGRSFSKAELLRERYAFGGTLRATGDVLIDQIPHMLRVGFTEFEVTNPVAIRRLEQGRIGGIPQHYQPAAVSEAEGPAYAWRRLGTSAVS
ncbi:DUF934 domain-containing protein [Tianweitania sediminis]|uniref:DUF934 domain-containing protein n=1 Tax=Tianweitania sediminis TaxID=1502156 RepID=A0A8J7QVU7_9HYPH|nr:DUF934 domain-containing protein [Tianweitania sediminis]MBP0437393.1 DUF934 domain-containing protein [Tianweitania sediminis]